MIKNRQLTCKELENGSQTGLYHVKNWKIAVKIGACRINMQVEEGKGSDDVMKAVYSPPQGNSRGEIKMS